jgi:hypothetical protein
VEGASRLDHVLEREALVDGHQLRAQCFFGGVHGDREPQRPVVLGEPFDAWDPADRGDGRSPLRHAEVGQALAGGEHRIEVEHRLAHAHEHAVRELVVP